MDADVGKSDVGDGEVQVGDRRDQDQPDKHATSVCRGGARFSGARRLGHRSPLARQDRSSR